MKSESTKMMRYMCLISCCLLVACGQTVEETVELSDSNINKNVTTSVSKTITSVTNSERENLNKFETAHKIQDNIDFESAHTIEDSKPIARLLDESVGDNLMQMQQTQNLLATKERPELNPVLSALINEDVMKSIESKRAIENEHQLSLTTSTETPVEEATTLANTIVLTTESTVNEKVEESANEGLIDQSITLDEAGSENNQKSRIQIKKGPNGVDYEYEYVYYYYDEDEKADKDSDEKTGSATNSKSKTASSAETNYSKDTPSRGKSRYTNIERSTTSAPDNEIPSKIKGRSSIPVTEDVDEGRLPVATRFPPRSKSIDPTPTSTPDADSSEKSKKIGVKRPSLELVDSDSFNTDEKQVKTNRNLDSETGKLGPNDSARTPDLGIDNKISDSPSASTKDDYEGEEEENSTDGEFDMENTTPLMEKVAFDLYAILANENLNIDMTTDGSEDATTDFPNSTDLEELTTVKEEEEGEDEEDSSSTSTTTTATTTTTTTTPEPTTTTTTTTTTPAPLPGGRRGGVGAGRNRFRIKPGSAPTTSSSSSSTETPTESTTKGRNRFQRPSFGGRTSKAPTTASSVKEDTVTKEEAKPVSSANTGRGRTRNRFNLRGTTSTSTTERSAEENAVDGQEPSTTARNLRARPTLNLRGRGRPTTTTAASAQPAAVAAATAPASNSESEGSHEEKTEEKPTSSLPTRPSRFNINRPAGAGGNRLLPRGRLNPLKTTPATTEAAGESEEEEKKENETKEAEVGEETASESGEEKPTEATTQAAGGLNRLRNRPRIQINTKTEKPKSQPIAVNRKVNPLLARRKIGLGSSTTEAPPAEEDEEQKAENDESKEESAEKKDEVKDETTEAVEVSSEQPRGLGLLGNRRRLPLRKPGTLL